MPRHEICALLLAFLLLCGKETVCAQTKDSDTAWNAHTDLIYPSDNNLFQDYYIIAPKKINVVIQIKAWFLKSEHDSILVYKNISQPQAVKKGLNIVKNKFQGDADKNYINPSFAAAIKKRTSFLRKPTGYS